MSHVSEFNGQVVSNIRHRISQHQWSKHCGMNWETIIDADVELWNHDQTKKYKTPDFFDIFVDGCHFNPMEMSSS